jgi:hypothetical protein
LGAVLRGAGEGPELFDSTKAKGPTVAGPFVLSYPFVPRSFAEVDYHHARFAL